MMDHGENFREAWLGMIESCCYNDYPQAFFKAIDALFEANAIDLDVRDDLISHYSAKSREQD